MVRTLLLVFGLVLGAEGTLQAQLSVVGLRNLAFGPVIQGINTTVAPTDPIKSGQYEFMVPIGTRVRIQFTLPNRLNGPAGARMNVQFPNNGAIVINQAPSSVPNSFNPHAPQNITVSGSNRVWVFLGGTVSPSAGQTTGNYSNTVTLTVTVL